MEKPLTLRLPFPHAGQRKVRKEAKRFNWLSAGRRWRKTTLAVAIGAEEALNGKRLIWGAPTFGQVRIAWDEMKKAMDLLVSAGAANFNVSRMELTLPISGGSIVFRSLDNPDNARGHTADGIILDEVGDIRADAWYEVLRPTIIDTGGWLWAIGTPKGRNWFWQEHYMASKRGDSAAWQVPTLGVAINEDGVLVRKRHRLENPHIKFEEIEHLYNTTPLSAFKQEILAEFLEGEGTVFRNIVECTRAPYTTPNEHKGHNIRGGIDWGKQNDFTAISLGCVNCGHEVFLDRFNQIDYSYQRDRIKQAAKDWNVSYLYGESNSIGAPNVEMLIREGVPVVPFETTYASKTPLIENMVLHFEKKLFQFLDDREATKELEAFERTITEMGRQKFGAPKGSGFHDDTVIARALMLKAMSVMSLPTNLNLTAPAKFGSVGSSDGPTGTIEKFVSRWRKF